MRISDWSSDVCSSDLQTDLAFRAKIARRHVEDTALEEDIVIVRVVRFETERGLVLAQCDLKRLVTDILHIGVLQIHAVAGKIRLDPPVEVLEGRALKPQPRTAKAGSIIAVMAAPTFVDGHKNRIGKI